MRIKIIHLEGSRSGQQQELPGPMLIFGRDPSCNVAFDPMKDDAVSTRHAQIQIQGPNLILTDLGSRNGTFLNGQKVTQPCLVSAGATIQLGENGPKVIVQPVPDAAARKTPPMPVPAAAPPPPPQGGGGGKTLCVLGCLFLLAVLICGGGGYYYYTTQQKPADGGGDKPPEDKPPADKPPEAPPEKKDRTNAWGKLKIGTVIEQKMVSDMKVPVANKSETKTKYTLKSRDDKNAQVEVESLMTVAGSPITTVNMQDFPIQDPEGPAGGAAAKGPKPVITNEDVEVKGLGKVKCEKIMVRETVLGVEKSKTETWMAADRTSFPLTIKMVSKSPMGSTTIETLGVTIPK